MLISGREAPKGCRWGSGEVIWERVLPEGEAAKLRGDLIPPPPSRNLTQTPSLQ